MFWLIVLALILCNGLLAWSSSFKEMSAGMRPRVLEQDWFALAQAIGGIGWVAIPLMFGWRYGVLAAAISFPAFIAAGLILRFAINGAMREVLDRERPTAPREPLESPVPPRPRGTLQAPEASTVAPPESTRVWRQRPPGYSYETKVRVLQNRIADRLIRTERVVAKGLGAAEFSLWGSESITDDAIEKLETWQTWWAHIDSTSDTIDLTLHIKNVTKHALSAVLFELWETPCSASGGQRRWYALVLSQPLQASEERALQFSAVLPRDHAIRHGLVCGKIVGAR